MRIIIVGGGKIGSALALSLLEEKHDVIVIDKNAKVVETLDSRYDVMGLIGDGCTRSILETAEIKSCDLLIAATADDENNIICCILAKKMGAKRTIARVHNPKYFRKEDSLHEEFGLDMTFNPEFQTSQEIAHVLRFPAAKRLDTFSGGIASMASVDLEEGNPLIGMSLIEIAKTYGQSVIFGIVERNDEVFIPRGDFVLKKDDCISIVGTEITLGLFFKKLHIFKSKVKSVSIIGGGNIGYYLAKELLENKIEVKITERDNERCQELATELVGATILCGDGTDQHIQDEEELFLCDACVTLTGIDEENVLLSLYAKSKGVDKVVTKVDRANILNMVENLGLDSIVSPKEAIATHIIRFVRMHEEDTLGSMEMNRLYKIHEQAEAIEFIVTDKFEKCQVCLKDLKIKDGILIGGVIREGKFILPVGNTQIEKGDRVLVITAHRGLKKLSQILR